VLSTVPQVALFGGEEMKGANASVEKFDQFKEAIERICICLFYFYHKIYNID
jgi:hypothetical protein